MSICRINLPNGQPSYALYRDGKVCPLAGVTSFDQAIEVEDSSGDWIDAPQAFLPPVDRPEKILCIGLNYRDHAIETGAEIPTLPVVFSKFNTTLIGHGDSIRLPAISKQVDYEAELVVVIGRTTKDVSMDEAMQSVYGYTCGHDVSARDWQKGRPGGQWLLGKTFDTFAPTGPWIVPAGEIPDPSNLQVQMKLNGQVVQESSTAQLIFDIPHIVSHLSKFVTLVPGDLIFTGTPPGVGDAKDPPVYLKPGDTCSVTVEGIGTLTNDCVAD